MIRYTIAVFFTLLTACGPSVTVDTLITGGQVVDGTGTEPYSADVGITGDRITFIGDAAQEGVAGTRMIDAAGLIVAPGFIDPHTHTLGDLSDTTRHDNDNYLMQGVTTVITGNDGGGPFETAERYALWEKQGIGTNAGLMVGHGTVRREVMGMRDAAPTADELAQMEALVRQGMDGVALGLSTGLYYAPGSYAKTEEVIALAKVAAAAGGIFDSHMRDESSYTIGLLGSIDETIRIAREADIPVHISHIKALGVDVWGQSTAVIERIRKARDEGLQVTADQYPYVASGTGLSASLVPRWAQAGGRTALLERLADPKQRRRIMTEMQENLRRRGGPASLLMISSSDTTLLGRTLEDLAQDRGKPPIETAVEIIRHSDAGVASFNMQDEDLERFMQQDFVMTGSDGSTGHPRKYGTYPLKLRKYVYEKKLITLPFAVRAGSGLVAETFKIKNRGLLQTGYYADVIVFDEMTINARSTFEKPREPAVGMRYVFVNGTPAVEAGRYTGVLAGRVVKRAE